ncbi:RNA polymerase sigma-70 factor (ECF subfamily) [Nicoletella semolina]|uniref:RNA polymerase sigma factor n=1 Tax=Nicoletella semolina TaxID=271160 RepID=A0A4R2N747_9PAST|nr:sigma-70 family RNA polymerase sigma factor [Nicoletella semolina]MDH2924718.1 RNA polymerase subunit sigma [Nicoletella semolina]TCP16658.1 RNA polymerase sigma-70 factor (ECF subfamily) [Nicoletella semolina]
MPSTPQTLDSYRPEELETIRRQMLHFAKLQLQDIDLAEDVVQESLASAYKNASSFKGRAALKTWIFAILKNKIIDILHHQKRTVTLSELDTDNSSEFFDKNGHWQQNMSPNEWRGIDSQIYQQEFWVIFDLCLNKLPPLQARVFMMREHLELTSQQICDECGISTANLHVLLYRSRLQLQRCLTKNWFEK